MHSCFCFTLRTMLNSSFFFFRGGGGGGGGVGMQLKEKNFCISLPILVITLFV